MTAYIGKSTDREGDTFYTASICEDGDELDELSSYDRDFLVSEVERRFPEANIENA